MYAMKEIVTCLEKIACDVCLKHWLIRDLEQNFMHLLATSEASGYWRLLRMTGAMQVSRCNRVSSCHLT